nr:glutathione S-transferase [Allopusillimonas soli]
MPILYSFRRCPYAMRARLALLASGMRCELREVVLRDKPPAMLAASPKGTVPVLVDGGEVVDQSLDIMLWALRRHDPYSWLAPQAEDVAGMLALIDACDQHFKPQLDRYKYPQRFEGADASASRDTAAQWLRQLEARLARQQYLCGSHIALADMAILPFVRQYAHVDDGWFQEQGWQRLSGWLASWEQGPWFAGIMARHAPWRAGETGPVFPDEAAIARLRHLVGETATIGAQT